MSWFFYWFISCTFSPSKFKCLGKYLSHFNDKWFIKNVSDHISHAFESYVDIYDNYSFSSEPYSNYHDITDRQTATTSLSHRELRVQFIVKYGNLIALISCLSALDWLQTRWPTYFYSSQGSEVMESVFSRVTTRVNQAGAMPSADAVVFNGLHYHKLNSQAICSLTERMGMPCCHGDPINRPSYWNSCRQQEENLVILLNGSTVLIN